MFFAILFTIYGSINFYIFVRGWQSIPRGSAFRNAYVFLFWFVALAFIGGRALENVWDSVFSELLIWVGSFWFAAMVYFFIAAIFCDLLRLANHFLPFFPSFIKANYAQMKYFTSAAVVLLVAILLLVGHINSLLPRIKRLNLSVDKKAAGMKSVDIVVASDIHLGTIVGRSRLDRIISKINDLNPDIVLLPGDIVDEDLGPVIKQNIGDGLRNIKTRFGVFAVTGNHEHIGGVEEACRYLAEHNVVMLRDQTVKVNGSFFLVGREDGFNNMFSGKRRKYLEELVRDVDKSLPIILMDHQPSNFEEAVSNGIDLQVSGHTHYGQIWPLNFIIEAIYEVAWGYSKRADTHIYVSNGVGTWGPPVRIGNRPEIVYIQLNFN